MATDSPVAHPDEWPVVRLGDIALKIGSGATPRGGKDAYLSSRSRFALVRSQNVFDRRFDRTGLAFITDEQADALDGVRLQPNDLLLNITGDGITFARVCPTPEDVLPACVNQHVAIIRVEPGSADPGYVLSFLTHPTVKRYIESFNAGGSRRAITKGHIESFQLPLPPLKEQRAIAHVLRTLDDKIELNRRMSETLVAIARGLFKSWLVDFEPVRAKAEGRDPGIPKHLTDLFPQRLVDSELGEVPEGWVVGSFGDVGEELRDREDPLASPEAVFCHFSLPAFDEGQGPKVELGKEIKSLKSRVPPGTILLSKLNPEIERVWLVDIGATDRGVCSTEFLVLRPRPPYRQAYVYCVARSHFFRQNLEALVTGTSKSHQRAHLDSIGRIPVILPPQVIADAFDRTASSLLARAHQCHRESLTLVALRHALLPRLISGELRVKDAERAIKSAL